MSGGSWGYLYRNINDAAFALQRGAATERDSALDLNEEQREKRRKLGELLEKVAHALHEIEWVDSCDSSFPSDTQAIDAVFASLGRVPKIELRHDDKGLLDEVVAREATIHMEDMGSSWSILIDAGEDHLSLSFGGRLKRPLVIDQSGSVISTHPKR